MLEVVAQILAIVTLRTDLATTGSPSRTTLQASGHSINLHRIYGRDPSVNGMMSAFWSLAASTELRSTFYRFTSEADIVDLISRADCPLASRHGWTQAHIRLEAILKIRAWAADDREHAVHGAADDLQAL